MLQQQPLDEEKTKKYIAVAEVFSPSAPINKHELFSGRGHQISDVINAVAQRGQHVILFGERGVGKTSLANVISEMMKNYGLRGVDCGIINCDGTDDFSSLWRKVFQEITFTIQKNSIGYLQQSKSEDLAVSNLLPENITPDTVRFVLQKHLGRTIIVIDEIDRLEDKNASISLADTIKSLSDHSVDTTIILVGVADSVNDLIAKHSSIERCLVQVQMPRMSSDELREIIHKGLAILGMSIDESVERQIAYLSQGFPNYTHALALYSAQSAVVNNRDRIALPDLSCAIATAIQKTQQSITSAYHKATSSSRETLYSDVLLACALAPTDNLGFFTTSDVRKPMSIIKGRNYEISAFSPHINEFCEKKRGFILQKRGTTRNYRFRFANPLMQPYIVISGLDKGIISLETLNTINDY